jgi:hypothetical protein
VCCCREILEMTRKVMLTGVMIFFRPGSVQQLLVGSLIAAAYLVAAVARRPFVSQFDNNFKIVSQMCPLTRNKPCSLVYLYIVGYRRSCGCYLQRRGHAQ